MSIERTFHLLKEILDNFLHVLRHSYQKEDNESTPEALLVLETEGKKNLHVINIFQSISIFRPTNNR